MTGISHVLNVAGNLLVVGLLLVGSPAVLGDLGTSPIDPVITDPVITDPAITDPVITDPVVDPPIIPGLGEPCTDTCQPEYTCDGGVCITPVVLVALGGTCGSTTECEASLECVDSACSTPVVTIPSGGACDTSTSTCEAPTTCVDNVCTDPTSETAPGLGEPCGSDTLDCSGALTCDGGTCVQDATTALGGVGDTCADDDECQATLECDAESCVASEEATLPPTPTTPPPPPPDAGCTADSPCEGEFECIKGECVKTIVYTLSGIGGKCTATAPCAEGLMCESNICEKPEGDKLSNEGETCDNTESTSCVAACCVDGLECKNKTCVRKSFPPADLGDPCGGKTSCMNKYTCFNGTCITPTDTRIPDITAAKPGTTIGAVTSTAGESVVEKQDSKEGSDKKDDSNSLVLIIGGAVVGLIAASVLCCVAFLCCHRRRKKKEDVVAHVAQAQATRVQKPGMPSTPDTMVVNIVSHNEAKVMPYSGTSNVTPKAAVFGSASADQGFVSSYRPADSGSFTPETSGLISRENSQPQPPGKGTPTYTFGALTTNYFNGVTTNGNFPNVSGMHMLYVDPVSCATSASSKSKSPVAGVHAALDYIQSSQKGQFDQYMLDKAFSRQQGGQAVVAMIKGLYGGTYAGKFYQDNRAFKREVEVYKVLNSWGGAAHPFISAVVDNTESPLLENGMKMPSYIVMDRGESMRAWISNRKPPPLMALWMLGEVCGQLSVMHAAGFVHRDVKPGNVLWIPDHNKWRLIDFGSAARIDEWLPPSFTLRFAAPETIQHTKDLHRESNTGLSFTGTGDGYGTSVSTPHGAMRATTQEDVWAIGVMAFELLTGQPMYPDESEAATVKNMLLGDIPFLHEEDPSIFASMGRLANMVMSMLNRDPSMRPSIADAAKILDETLSQ